MAVVSAECSRHLLLAVERFVDKVAMGNTVRFWAVFCLEGKEVIKIEKRRKAVKQEK